MADPGRLEELKRKFEENPKRYFAPLANEYRKAGDPERAIELSRTYLPQQPTHMSGYIVYGQALHDAGQTEEAAAVFKQALTLDPENLIALRHLGDIARDAGDNAGAMRWYGKVLELDPRNEEIAAYIDSLTQPGSVPRVSTPVAERQPPPAVRPEPEYDDAAVRLEDIVSEPDAVQSPFASGFVLETEEAFEATRWTSAAEGEEQASGKHFGSPNALEGPWHATTGQGDPVSDHSSDGDESPLNFSDFMPDERPPEPDESPFVTETMAELYVQQGLHGEALVMYRQLALRRDDPALRQRIAELESRHAAKPVAETVRAFFERLGSVRPGDRVEMAADRASPLSALFGSDQANAEDLTAANRLSSAFGDPRARDSRS